MQIHFSPGRFELGTTLSQWNRSISSWNERLICQLKPHLTEIFLGRQFLQTFLVIICPNFRSQIVSIQRLNTIVVREDKQQTTFSEILLSHSHKQISFLQEKKLPHKICQKVSP